MKKRSLVEVDSPASTLYAWYEGSRKKAVSFESYFRTISSYSPPPDLHLFRPRPNCSMRLKVFALTPTTERLKARPRPFPYEEDRTAEPK